MKCHGARDRMIKQMNDLTRCREGAKKGDNETSAIFL